jgi:hypothetical protein
MEEEMSHDPELGESWQDTMARTLRYAQFERGGPPGDYLAEDVIDRVISELSRLRDDLTTPGGDHDAEWAAEGERFMGLVLADILDLRGRFRKAQR